MESENQPPLARIESVAWMVSQSGENRSEGGWCRERALDTFPWTRTMGPSDCVPPFSSRETNLLKLFLQKIIIIRSFIKLHTMRVSLWSNNSLLHCFGRESWHAVWYSSRDLLPGRCILSFARPETRLQTRATPAGDSGELFGPRSELGCV